MNSPENDYYVVGGMFGPDDNKEFKLLSPSGEDAMPHVRKGLANAKSLHQLVEKHADLFKLSADLSTATLALVGKGYNYPTNPYNIKLSPQQQADIRKAIESIEP